MQANSFDTRFVTEPALRRAFLDLFMQYLQPKDLFLIKSAAIRLEIPDWETKPAVDTLYDIACRLAVFEPEVCSPELIMEKIKLFLETN